LRSAYWQPLHAYVRRSGYNKEQAEDITQAFFERLLDKNYLAAVDPSKGKFRSFLIASLKNVLRTIAATRLRKNAAAARLSFPSTTVSTTLCARIIRLFR
jgi:RNA polymerase sigma-70 factor (ECF subfamily)